MQVILLEKVGKMGVLGDSVEVKNGYARNYLIPAGKAVAATADNVRYFEERRAELEKAEADKLAIAQSRADELAERQFTTTAKAGDEGKLFGSVGPKDIADLVTAGGIALEKSEVKMPDGAIRNVGEYDIVVQLHTDVSTTIKVAVVDEA